MFKTSIHSLHIGRPKTIGIKRDSFVSGVRKETVSEAFLTEEGFSGDEVANKKHHGGRDRAVLIYSFDHYHRWNEEFATRLRIPAFGENITVRGMTEKDVYIGDIYQIGEAVIQITQGRIPCATLSKSNENEMILPRLVETGFTGYLAKVIKEGKILADSKIMLLERDPHAVSIHDANVIYYHDKQNKQAMEEILAIEPLAEVWKNKLRARLKS